MTVVSLSIELRLLRRFEAIVTQEGFKSRSEAFRVAVREFVEKYEVPDIGGGDVETIIGFSYVDSVKIRNLLNTIQHEYMGEIKEVLHRHVSDNNCFELIITEGSPDSVRPLVSKLRATRGIDSFFTTTYQK